VDKDYIVSTRKGNPKGICYVCVPKHTTKRMEDILNEIDILEDELDCLRDKGIRQPSTRLTGVGCRCEAVNPSPEWIRSMEIKKRLSKLGKEYQEIDNKVNEDYWIEHRNVCGRRKKAYEDKLARYYKEYHKE
jgi:hypothetical protein